MIEESKLLNVSACQPATLLPIHVPGNGKLALWGGRCGGHREHIPSDLGEVGADLLGLLPDLKGVDRWVHRDLRFDPGSQKNFFLFCRENSTTMVLLGSVVHSVPEKSARHADADVVF